MRVLARDVLVPGEVIDFDRLPAGMAEADLPEGIEISNPAAWIESDSTPAGDSPRITEQQDDEGENPRDDFPLIVRGDSPFVTADKPVTEDDVKAPTAPTTVKRRTRSGEPPSRRRRPSTS